MKANEYQKLANRTLTDKPGFAVKDEEVMVVWNALGLVGEAGEVAENIKKGVFHRHGVDKATLRKEIGDVLWYIAALCTNLGFNMEDVMQENIDKLRLRYPNGFSTDDSKRRLDVQ